MFPQPLEEPSDIQVLIDIICSLYPEGESHKERLGMLVVLRKGN